MNFEPFAPGEQSEPVAPTQDAVPGPPAPHFFDSAGLLWILGCLLFASLAGRILPVLAQPDGLQRSLVAMGWGVDGEAVSVVQPVPYAAPGAQPEPPTQLGGNTPADVRGQRVHAIRARHPG